MATQPHKFSTVEEYLAGEEQSEIKHEYWSGHIVAMAGGSPTHADITANLNALIKSKIRRSGCYVRGADQRVRTSPSGLYTYPDLVISCKSEFDRSTLLNPLVLIEVLSESTEDYDRGSKFERYSHIPSFREYICVAQDRVYVEHHVRDRTNPAMWTMQRLERLNEQVTISLPLLDSGSISISLEDIYDDLELGMPEKEARK
jgi:Uma2 family endonuclease